MLVFEAFARLLATSLGSQLRSSVVATVKSVDQRDYASIVSASDDPTWIAALSLGAVGGQAVIDLSMSLAMMLVERVLGGSGAGPHPNRGLTELETTLVAGLIESGLSDLATALAPLCVIQPEIVRVETQAELLKAAPQAEAYAVTVLSVDLPETGTGPNKVTVALPLHGLEPAFEAFAGGSHKAELDIQPVSIVDHLLDAPVDVSQRFRPISMRAADLVQLEEGQIIGLDHRTSAPLALDVEGTEVLAAKPGRLGRRLACVIVDPVTDLGATNT